MMRRFGKVPLLTIAVLTGANIAAHAQWPEKSIRMIVPYGAGNVTDIVGRVEATIDPVSVTLPHIQSDVLRPLAYTGPNRHGSFPNVPTMREAAPDAAVSAVWLGMLWPRGMPRSSRS
jgi:tripartite-type tricarboxylate transporter receptor subunit TctC